MNGSADVVRVATTDRIATSATCNHKLRYSARTMLGMQKGEPNSHVSKGRSAALQG